MNDQADGVTKRKISIDIYQSSTPFLDGFGIMQLDTTKQTFSMGICSTATEQGMLLC